MALVYPLTTSNYILYAPKPSCNIQHAKIHEITMTKRNLKRWYYFREGDIIRVRNRARENENERKRKERERKKIRKREIHIQVELTL